MCVTVAKAVCAVLLEPAIDLSVIAEVSLGCCDCRRTIYDDPFIRNYIEDLLKNIRTQVQHIARLKV